MLKAFREENELLETPEKFVDTPGLHFRGGGIATLYYRHSSVLERLKTVLTGHLDATIVLLCGLCNILI